MNKNQTVNKILHTIEQIGLLLIIIATIIAVGQELMVMIDKMRVDLKDLLLLFIYLEIIAMVKIYYEQHHLPIRYPIYIAIVALARYIILDSKSFATWQLLEVALTIVLLTLSVLVVRYGHTKLPYEEIGQSENKDESNGG
jgi:protein PsiE